MFDIKVKSMICRSALFCAMEANKIKLNLTNGILKNKFSLIVSMWPVFRARGTRLGG